MAKAKVDQGKKKIVPGSDIEGEKIFLFPFIFDLETVQYVQSHERVMFIIRGPAGTAKNTLGKILLEKYESGVVCSADNYFQGRFVSSARTKESLKLSHEYCMERVREECEKKSNPIIVKNTHIRKWEMRPYLDFAAKYKYTVVMAITLRKFFVTPEILAKSNRKGLSSSYCFHKLKTWEECYPVYLGWFLGPADSSYLLNKGKEAVSALIGDGRFCNTFGAFCEEEVQRFFVVEDPLFCIAAYIGSGSDGIKQKFYLSNTVQDVYGKYFAISIHGYIISKSFLLAVVALTSEMKSLILESKKRNSRNDADSLLSAFGAMNVRDPLESQHSDCTFEENFCPNGKTAAELDWDEHEDVNVKSVSFIVLGRGQELSQITDVQQFVNSTFSGVVNFDDDSANTVTDFSELDDGTKYIRLLNETWFIKASKKIQVGSIFTGLYN